MGDEFNGPIENAISGFRIGVVEGCIGGPTEQGPRPWAKPFCIFVWS